MRRELAAVALVAAAAFAIRIYPAWNGVFGGAQPNFLETDAWYHLRLAENQVRNFPWRITIDPFASPDGQYVPIAPLYDTLTATAVFLGYGRDARADDIAAVAAFVPPVLGTLAIVAAWALGRRVFGPRAGVLGAAMLAVLPGHFMDRTMLGFVDHHALEALLALVVLLAFVIAMREAGADERSARAVVTRGAAAGVVLGLYLLGWASGAFLVAIVALWIVLSLACVRSAAELSRSAQAAAIAAPVAAAIVIAFQNPAMHRYGSQLLSLAGLAVVGAIVLVPLRLARTAPAARIVAAVSLAAAAALGAGVAWSLDPDLAAQVVTDIARLAPDPRRTGVLEARPLFTYPGEWNWAQPWQFFRTGFYIGVAGLALLAWRIWRDRRSTDVLVWTFAAATIAATIGQNRFGYYMVPACALVGGWLADRLLDLARLPAGPATLRARVAQSAAVFAVAAMVAPSLAPNLLFLPRTGMFIGYWQEAMDWLRAQTDTPFAAAAGGDDYYYTRYDREPRRVASYTVMNWWDQGYYLIQRAHRVPVSNPTQERATLAAAFYTETDDARALALLARDRSRYVIADWELPYRFASDGTIAGRFQTLADWAGVTHSQYYEVAYRRTSDGWTPVWLFYEPYYRSMAYRLAVLGGAAATPAHATSVVTLADRTDGSGFRFRELVSQQVFPTYEAALAAAAGRPQAVLAGLDPWQAAFPLPALPSLALVHEVRTPQQKPSETPWIRIFEVGQVRQGR
jgi:dolichyl-diphosphooligosaccharide--protein glycosyltransferase